MGWKSYEYPLFELLLVCEFLATIIIGLASVSLGGRDFMSYSHFLVPTGPSSMTRS